MHMTARLRSWCAQLALPVAIGLILGSASGAALAGTFDAERSQGRVMIERLRADAQRGDGAAQAALTDVTNFMARQGLSEASLDAARAVDESLDIGGLRVRAEGLEPFYLKVTVSGQVDSAAALAGYRQSRITALSRLIESGEPVRAVLSFRGLVPLEAMLALRDAHGFQVRDAVLDVWTGAQWVTRYGHGPDDPAFWARPTADVLTAVRSEEERLASPERRVSVTRFTVHSVNVVASAGAARAITRLPNVLLLDPENDIVAGFANRAARVIVQGQPDVFDADWSTRARAGEVAYPFRPSQSVGTK
jgi:hypothetical protein